MHTIRRDALIGLTLKIIPNGFSVDSRCSERDKLETRPMVHGDSYGVIVALDPA